MKFEVGAGMYVFYSIKMNVCVQQHYMMKTMKGVRLCVLRC